MKIFESKTLSGYRRKEGPKIKVIVPFKPLVNNKPMTQLIHKFWSILQKFKRFENSFWLGKLLSRNGTILLPSMLYFFAFFVKMHFINWEADICSVNEGIISCIVVFGRPHVL